MPVAFATCGIVFGPMRFQEEILARIPVVGVLVAEVVPPRPAHDHDLDRVALRVHAELAVAVERERADVALGQAVAADQLVRRRADLVDGVRQLHVEQLRRVLEPLQVLPAAGRRPGRRGSRSSGCPRRHPCRSGARGRRRAPSRRPSRRTRRSSRSSRSRASVLLSEPESVCGVFDGVHRLRAREPDEDARDARQPCACRSRRRPRRCRGRAGSGRSARARRPEAETARPRPARSRSPPRTSAARAIRASAAPAARAILSRSARRSPGTSATTGRPSQTTTIDLTIWAIGQPAARAASSAVAVPDSSSSSLASAPASRR